MLLANNRRLRLYDRVWFRMPSSELAFDSNSSLTRWSRSLYSGVPWLIPIVTVDVRRVEVHVVNIRRIPRCSRPVVSVGRVGSRGGAPNDTAVVTTGAEPAGRGHVIVDVDATIPTKDPPTFWGGYNQQVDACRWVTESALSLCGCAAHH